MVYAGDGLRALEAITPGFSPGDRNLATVVERFEGHLIQGVETDARERGKRIEESRAAG
jgi:hypothetical protein